jgi:hypothetical protein
VDLGAADGVTTGQEFGVIRSGEAITDLEGHVIGTNSQVIGSILLTRVQDRFSEAAVKQKSMLFRKGDKVRPGEEFTPPDDESEKIEIKKEPKKEKKDDAPSDQKKPDVPPIF